MPICDKCQIQIRRVDQYTRHMRDCCKVSKCYCKVCKYTVAGAQAFKRHINSSTHNNKRVATELRKEQNDIQTIEEVGIKMNNPSEYELRRENNIREHKKLERSIFADYWGEEGGLSISQLIVDEKETDASIQDERDEDEIDDNLMFEGGVAIDEISKIEDDQEEADEDELNHGEFMAVIDDTIIESSAVRHSERLKYQSPTFDVFNQDLGDVNDQRNGTPPLPEEEREEPWHFSNIEEIQKWREFCRDEIFENIHQIEEEFAESDYYKNASSKRGSCRSTNVELDRILESSCTRRFVEWRRTMADGLSNEALNELLDILHSSDCNVHLLPRNHYHLEKLQDHALSSFKPKTTRWRIPKEKNDLESEQIIVTDIEHLLRLQLQDPEIARSIISDYSYNGGLISHPSHGELWKKLAAYDLIRGSHPLCLKLYFDDYQGQYYKEKQSAGLYLTLANLSPAMERKINNQFLICLLGPTANRRSALTIVLDMIWKLEKSPIMFQVGVPGDADAISVWFQVHLFALPADRKGSSEVIWHMGVAAAHPCHACNVERKEQCQIVQTGKNITEFMRDYGSLINDILRGCELRYTFGKTKAAKELQTRTGFYNMYLSPSMWSKFFNPIKQTPPCLMHNGPLGLIRTMILQFAEIHGEAFVKHVNNSVTNLCKFPGIPRISQGIYCEAIKTGANKSHRRYSLRKLNADQLMGFARSSPAFVWQVLPKAHFDLWVLVLNWFLTLYALEFYRNDLDCAGDEALMCIRRGGRLCIKHMGRHVVKQWLVVFAHPDLEHCRFSTSFWNLHVQLHMFWFVQQLGPLYLLATDLGESHHAIQKRFGVMTNHKYHSTEEQILKKNHIIVAWRFYNGRHTPSVHLLKEERSLHSPKLLHVKMTGALVDVLLNVVTNTWAPTMVRTDLPSEGVLFKKMRIHGHFVGCGDDVAVAHNENSSIPWFAKIVHFVRFVQGEGLQPWDVAEIRWYNSADRAMLPKEFRSLYLSLVSNKCALLKGASKLDSNDFVATTQILYRADIKAVKGESWGKAHGNPGLFIYNPWTSDRVFSSSRGT